MNMRLIPFCCLLMLSAGLSAQQVEIPVSEDSYVIKNNPDMVLISEAIMPVNRSDKTDHSQVLFNFDLRPYEGQWISNARLQFKIVEANALPENTDGLYYIKAVRVMPEVDLTSLTFNSFKYFQRPSGAGAPEVLKSYPYDVIHTFADAYTTTLQQEARHRARIVREQGSNKALVTIDLGNQLQDLTGAVITLVIEDHRSAKRFRIYSSESNEPEKPKLIVVLEPKPDSVLPKDAQVTNILQGHPLWFINNGLTGFYQWDGKNFNPNFSPAVDAYKRYFWRDLDNPSTAADELNILIDDIRRLGAGKKYAFRIRAMRDYGENYLPVDIAHLMKDCNLGDNENPDIRQVPDWEDPQLRARAAQFWHDLSVRLSSENLLGKIAWIDMGFVGRFGENNGACVDEVSNEILEDYVDMYFSAFAGSKVQLVSMTDNDVMLKRALEGNTELPVGIRRDSLGGDSTHFDKVARQFESWPELHQRWKYAPVVTEFGGKINSHDSMWVLSPAEVQAWHVTAIGNGNTVVGNGIDNNPYTNPDLAQYRDEFDQTGRLAGYRNSMDKWAVPETIVVDKPFYLYTAWNNVGNAPAYEDYTAYILFYQKATFIKEIPLTLNFRELLPTHNRITGINSPVEVMDEVQLGQSGTYDLYLQVRSNDGTRAMMKLNQHHYRLLPQPVAGDWLGKINVK